MVQVVLKCPAAGFQHTARRCNRALRNCTTNTAQVEHTTSCLARRGTWLQSPAFTRIAD